MKQHTTSEAPSTSRLAIVHDVDKFPVKWQDRVQFSQSQFANTVLTVLDPKTLLIESHHTMTDIERIFNITGLAPSLLLGMKSLIGKTLVCDGMRVLIRETGTSFAIRSLSAAVLPIKGNDTTVEQIGTTQTRWQKLMTPASNDEKFTIAA